MFSDRSLRMKPSFIREILKAASEPEMISFAGGLPNPNLFPSENISKSTQRVLASKGASSLQYSMSDGLPELKDWVSNYYWDEFEMKIEHDEILITNGAQQGLDLLARTFINSGDKVLIEEPGYLGAMSCFDSADASMIPISINHDGPNLTDFENTLLFNPDIKLFYSVPTYQNPSGACYNKQTRDAMISEMKKYNLLFIEDDPYCEIRFTNNKPEPMKKKLGDQGILLGSFSKTLSPGMRTGWVIASKQIIKALTVQKQSCDLHTSTLNQYIIYQFLKDYDFKEHLETIRNNYRQRRDVMCQELNSQLWTSVNFEQPDGGMFLWLNLPEDKTVDSILYRAMTEGLVFVPGSTFMLGKNSSAIRLNYSNSSDVEIKRGIEILRKCILE